MVAGRPRVLGRTARASRTLRGIARKVSARVKPWEWLTPSAANVGGDARPYSANTYHTVPEVLDVFEAHIIEVSSRPSVAVTAAAYVGLRARTLPPDLLSLQKSAAALHDWASEVKSGGVLLLHFDGMLDDMFSRENLRWYARWCKWQQRRGQFWCLSLPRKTSWLANASVAARSVLPAVHKVRGKSVVVITSASWITTWDFAGVVRTLGRKSTDLAAQHPTDEDPLKHLRGEVQRIRFAAGRRRDPLEISGKRARRAMEEQ